MSFLRLIPEKVEKPWGRRSLGATFAALGDSGSPIGEIRYRLPDPIGADRAELTIKYLFTSAPLSIQVHPDDDLARARGLPRGKDEAWIVLSAEPGAVIGFGTRRPIGRDALRAAALDGSIVDLIDWRPVAIGTMLYSPAGTVHAIGAGLTLVEVQQNLDLTYRLYDHGSDRPLDLDDGVATATLVPPAIAAVAQTRDGREILAGAKFVVERWRRSGRHRLAAALPVWLIPLTPVTIAGIMMLPGEVWFTDSPATLDCGTGGDLLLAYAATSPDGSAAGERHV